MFSEFWKEYNDMLTREWKKSWRKDVKKEYIRPLAFLVALLMVYILAIFQCSVAFQIVLMLILMSYVISLLVYVGHIDRKYEKQRESRVKDYRVKHIVPLCCLLRKYDVFNVSGIEWLIACCRKKNEKKQNRDIWNALKQIYQIAVYPLIAILIGALLKDIALETVVDALGKVIIAVVIMAAFVFCVYPIAVFLLLPERHRSEWLEEDLEYIKTQLDNPELRDMIIKAEQEEKSQQATVNE